MEILIKKEFTGIFSQLDITIKNPAPEDMPVVNKAIALVHDYNEEEIENA